MQEIEVTVTIPEGKYCVGCAYWCKSEPYFYCNIFDCALLGDGNFVIKCQECLTKSTKGEGE